MQTHRAGDDVSSPSEAADAADPSDPGGPAAAGLPPLPLFGGEAERPTALVEVAEQIDVERLIDAVIDSCADVVFTGQQGDEAFVERLRASVTQNAYALRDVIAGTSATEEVLLDDVLYFATVQARLRIPQKSMQRSYRVSFYVQWHLWTAALEAYAAREGLGAQESFAALRRLTEVLLGYQDHVASRVAETYTRDFEALNRSRAHVRRKLAQDVLQGHDERLSATDIAILAYPLEHHHVAVLLPHVAEGTADRLAEGVRRSCGAYQTLVYPVSLTSTVIWLARIEPWCSTQLDALVAHLERVGVVATVSNPGSATAGFRRSIAQAKDADRIREAWRAQDATGTPPVVRYADAGLEILLLQDDDLARTFVESELGELAADTAEACRLRDTLEASFRYGSHVAAAEHLALHEHTVRNRLHRAESILGRSLQERRTELQVAVRLVRLLGGQRQPG